MDLNKIILGDSKLKLAEIPSNSVDACVCDPPYGFSITNKVWDDDCPAVDIWREVYRVLKPGAHLMAFSGARTTDLVMGRIREAGFEVRDMLVWVYGEGYPKSEDIGKAIDKGLGAERKVAGTAFGKSEKGTLFSGDRPQVELDVTAAGTDLAARWDGWGTQLKPAVEPITWATKGLTVVPPYAIIAHITYLMEALLCLLLHAKFVDKILKSSQTDCEEAGSDFALWSAVEKFLEGLPIKSEKMDIFRLQEGASIGLNIVSLWNGILAALYHDLRKSTILTEIGLITELRTLSYCLRETIYRGIILAEESPANGSSANALNAEKYFNGKGLKFPNIQRLFADASVIEKIAGSILTTLVNFAGQNLEVTIQSESIAGRNVITLRDARPIKVTPITLARKPLSGPLFLNVIVWGTGGINVDGCRVPWANEEDRDIAKHTVASYARSEMEGLMAHGAMLGDRHVNKPEGRLIYTLDKSADLGRWPSNVIMAHHPECKYQGTKKIPGHKGYPTGRGGTSFSLGDSDRKENPLGDVPVKGFADEDGMEMVEDWVCHPDCPIGLIGERSRYFYIPKARRDEREAGLIGNLPCTVCKNLKSETHMVGGREERCLRNPHPTVKPIELMRYLVRMITPPGGLVIDPFTGTGTTLIAAVLEGVNYIGLEKYIKYLEVAKHRVNYWTLKAKEEGHGQGKMAID